MTNVQLDWSTMNHIGYAIAVMRRDELIRQAAERRRATPSADPVDGACGFAVTRQAPTPRRLRRLWFVHRQPEPPKGSDRA
jgi:hypothetical protein